MAPLRILFLVSTHNSLSQAAWIALTDRGHDVTVAVVESAADMESAVAGHECDLIVCPILKTLIPESIWSRHRCLIVHPGPPGDRGPSSLDWAIELGERDWGVTVIEANGEFDAGEVWAARPFCMRDAGKASIYRQEVRRAAVEAILEAVAKHAVGAASPGPLDSREATVGGRARPLMTQAARAIDWHSDPTDTVIRKLRAAEGHPGVLDTIDGVDYHLFGVHRERVLSGRPGGIVATRNGAICRATVDGAVWITHLRRPDTAREQFFKLPAQRALAVAGCTIDAPEIPAPLHAALPSDLTYREIRYEEAGGVGYLHFDFYNGAMSTAQCVRLRHAYAYARSRAQTSVIALMGGSDFFSNGIHLGLIEAAKDPAGESWRNLHAIDDLVRDIIETESHAVISVVGGDAGAGGVPLALAADQVVAREDAVLNPYYGHMGGLYGSEYWTYLLPRRVGAEMTARLVGPPFTPVGAGQALGIGLLDAVLGVGAFEPRVRRMAERLAQPGVARDLVEQKRRRRTRDEAVRPLQSYRNEELARSYECFFGSDDSYHHARRRFCHKIDGARIVALRADARVARAA